MSKLGILAIRQGPECVSASVCVSMCVFSPTRAQGHCCQGPCYNVCYLRNVSPMATGGSGVTFWSEVFSPLLFWSSSELYCSWPSEKWSLWGNPVQLIQSPFSGSFGKRSGEGEVTACLPIWTKTSLFLIWFGGIVKGQKTKKTVDVLTLAMGFGF